MVTRVRARQKGITGYINAQRPTWLSNPFTLEEYPDLDHNLYEFEEFFRWQLDMDEELAKRFDSIPEDATIGCTCKKESRCHVDILIKIWNERNKEEEENES